MTVDQDLIEHLQREGGHHERPGEYLGDSSRDMQFDDGRKVVKKNFAPKESKDRPEFFLGGSAPAAPSGPKRKLRSSWLGAVDTMGKTEEPPHVPTSTRKWKPPATFKKLPPKTNTHDGSSGLGDRRAGKKPGNDIPVDALAEVSVEGTPDEQAPKGINGISARAKLSSQSLPPSKFGFAPKKNASIATEPTAPSKPVIKGSYSVRNLNTVTPKPTITGSYSVRNLKHVEPSKPLAPPSTSKAGSDIPPFKLKHVENPPEEIKPTAATSAKPDSEEVQAPKSPVKLKPVVKSPGQENKPTTTLEPPTSPIKDVKLKHVDNPPEEKRPGETVVVAGDKPVVMNKRASLRKVGLPPENKNDMDDQSAKDQAQKPTAEVKKLKHVESPPEESKSGNAAEVHDNKPVVNKRASLGKLGFPPENGMDESAKEQPPPTNGIAKRASLRKVGLPKGEDMDMSSSEQQQTPAANPDEPPVSPVKTVKLKHVEHPGEEKKAHASTPTEEEADETPVMKRPSLRKVGLPEGEMDQSAKSQGTSTMDMSVKEDDKLMNGSSSTKKEEPKTASPKPVKTSSNGKTKTPTKPMSPAKVPASSYTPTEEDFINCGTHDALLKSQEKEMNRLRQEKEDLEKKIIKAKKDYTKLENKLNTVKMVLDQGLKKEGMKNIWA